MRTRTKFAFGFGATGFLIGAMLCAYTFYVTSSHYRGGPPPIALYLLLCPASFGAMALDNAGVVGGLIGWFFISLINAALMVPSGLDLEKGQKGNKCDCIRSWPYFEPMNPWEAARPDTLPDRVLALIMALHSKRIDYTVYVPNYEPDKGCWDFRTMTKARLAAKKLGVGARLRRNVNVTGKNRTQVDWRVERVWEWDGKEFIDITKNPARGLP